MPIEEKKKSVPSILSEPDKIITIKSIAVLPFVNAGNEPEQDYLGDGIAEEVLFSLARLRDLKVARRALSFPYRAPQASSRSIGERLSVAVVMDGSVVRKAEKIMVSVRMTGTHEASAFWSREYKRGLDKFFSLPAEITSDSAEALQVALKEPDKRLINKKYEQSIREA